MSSDYDVGLAQFLTMALLAATVFLSFYLSSLGNFLNKIISSMWPSVPLFEQLVPLLMFGLFAGIISILYASGGREKIKIVGLFSFVAFIPSAINFSSINSSQLETTLFGIPKLFLTTLAGIILIFCLVLSNTLMKIKEAEKELLSRGGDTVEIQTEVSGSFHYTIIVTFAAAVISIICLVIMLAAQPIGATLIRITSYTTLVFGVTALVILATLVYYYLVKTAKRS